MAPFGIRSPSRNNHLDVADVSTVMQRGKMYRFSESTAPSAPLVGQLTGNEFTLGEYDRKYNKTQNNVLQYSTRMDLIPSAPELSSSSLEVLTDKQIDRSQLKRSDSMDILKAFKNVFLVRDVIKGILKALSVVIIVVVIIALAV